ncbi:MAG TPA: hypothetical protein VHO69_18925 [Phototrophicaceae bacterium]|nr:hypothetical protein [Phototrophicaceae bacterium]
MSDYETPEVEQNPEANVPAEDEKNPLESFIYHQRRALEEAGKAIDSLLPDRFKEHGSAASKEFVRSFQVLVDAAITEIERATSTKVEDPASSDDDDRPSTTGKTKIRVEVE